MKHILLFMLTLTVSSCFNNFEREYYEKISGIKFPERYRVLETFDNGEWLTGTVFSIDSSTLLKFVFEYDLDTLRNSKDIRLLSNHYLRKNKLNLKTTRDHYFLSKSKDKNSWTYVADPKNCKLWAEIRYPDWAGD